MLQQTTVAAVVPYFERFLAAFPTLADLAAADEQAVLRLWEGLGYYRRARHLHQAARRLAADHAGRLPDDPAVWHTLPGVGRYILGAVLSQAFDRRLPIVEANSQRVICRLFGQRGDPRTGPVKAWLWRQAEGLLPKSRAGDFNQALMELGALVCTPAAPRCGDCPLARDCEARRLGLQEAIPPKPPPPKVVEVSEAGVVLRDGPRVLLAQRRADAPRWANMWEFPHGERADGETHEQAAGRLMRELTGFSGEVGAEVMTLRHAVTRFRITVVCLEARRTGGAFRSDFYADSRWLTAEELRHYPVSAPQRKLAEAVAGSGRQRRLF
jgi:A/G-specific adenine glycosylase